MITQTYALNLIPGGVPVRVPVSQYDADSRELIFSLYCGNTLFSIPAGAVVTCDGIKPDRKGFSYPATVSGHAVTVPVTQQMTAAAGLAECQITITKNGKVLGSANFLLVVERAALPEDSNMSASEIASIETWKNQSLAAAQAAAARETDAAGSAAAASQSANSAQNSAASAASAASNAAAETLAILKAASAEVQQYSGNIDEMETGITWINPNIVSNLPISDYGFAVTLGIPSSIQEFYPISGGRCQRIRYDGGSGTAWTAWEWLDCPGQVDVDYRTTERWAGQPVYRRTVYLGAIGDKSVNVQVPDMGANPCKPIRCEGVARLGDDDYYTLPDIQTSVSINMGLSAVGINGGFAVRVGAADDPQMPAYLGWATVWYIK